jgi:very-short-patch-repair endonuclease
VTSALERPFAQAERMDAATALVRFDGIASGRELARAGVGRDRVDRAVRSGEIVRVRRGWFATPGADPARVRAVAASASLSCVSALEQYGLWLMPFRGCHVRLDPRRRSPRNPELRVHWLPSPDLARGGRDTLVTALDTAIMCLDAEGALVAVDSALNKKYVTLAELRHRFRGKPRHMRVLSRAVTTSESGTETLVRTRLRGRGVKLRIQVRIGGVGRVDILVGDRLIIEVDGKEHHDDPDAFTRDRRRDLAAHARGYLTIRLSYRQVMYEWPEVERQVLALIRRDEHLWRARHRAAASAG